MKRPIALTIAGSDSSGGAGIQADLKTFGAFGVYGATAITAVTAQNTVGVQSVFAVPTKMVSQQIKSVFADLDVAAIKIGMLANVAIIDTVARGLSDAGDKPLVVDPVMVATSGDVLLEPNAVLALRNQLFPRACVITPNLDEAAVLLEGRPARCENDMLDQARALLKLGSGAVLLKGGHLESDDAIAADLLMSGAGYEWFRRPRVATRHTHGTGCTLAAAITAGLAMGTDLKLAVQEAKDYLTRALISGKDLQIGSGAGPVDHLV
ncbi:MAG: bifunctional hydroxymethylpyrimidine kinase/phosphomethylpyrimidine kinase [Hyphomicrobiaceae bacterium]